MVAGYELNSSIGQARSLRRKLEDLSGLFADGCGGGCSTQLTVLSATSEGNLGDGLFMFPDSR